MSDSEEQMSDSEEQMSKLMSALIKVDDDSGATLHLVRRLCWSIRGAPTTADGTFWLQLRLIDGTILHVSLTDPATGLLCGWVRFGVYGSRATVQICRMTAPRGEFTAECGYEGWKFDCAVKYSARTGRVTAYMGWGAYSPVAFPASDAMRFELEMEECSGSNGWSVGVISFATPVTRVGMLLRTRALVLDGRAVPAAGTSSVAAWVTGRAKIDVFRRVCELLKDA